MDELLRMLEYRDKLRLPVTSMIHLLEMHGHISHPETILDPLEVTYKKSVVSWKIGTTATPHLWRY